ncbi:hypothetical protein ACTA71_010016 [Dictyostelium dimigraforme]
MDNNINFEILFWKVFKNIFLFKYIIKGIKSNKTFRNYSYCEIHRVEWMIENGYFELLKEKIKKGEYLVFGCRFIRQSKQRGKDGVLEKNYNFNFKYSIFNYFKDDYQLFLMLFKNYNLYFQTRSSCELIERISIETDNMAALKVIVENYNFKPDIESFFKSFEIGSITVSQYLYQVLFLNLNIKFTKDQIEKLWRLTFSNCNTISEPYSSSPPFSKLIIKHITDKEVADDILINKTLFIVNVLKLTPTISSLKPLESFFDFKIFKEPLSKLLACCKIISILSNFQSLHQVFNQRFLKEKNHIEDIKIRISLKNLEQSLLKSSVLNLENNTKTQETIKQSELIFFEKINKIKFTKKELSSSIYTLIDNFNYISQPNSITTIEDIRKLYEMFIKFTTFGKNNLLDNFTFFRNKFYKETFSELRFKSFTNQSIKELIKNDKIEIIGNLCKEDKLIIDEDISPYYNMKSIEMFDLIYKYDKEKHDDILLLLFFNNKIANHFKQSYSKQYHQTLKKSTLKHFNYQSFNFIFENWLDFTIDFKRSIISLIRLKILTTKIPLTDFKKFIEFLKVNFDSFHNNYNTYIPFYKNVMELDITTFEQVSYLINNNYVQIEKSFTSFQFNAPIYCIYYLRGELDKIVCPRDQILNDLILVIKEMIKKGDTKSFQYITSLNKGHGLVFIKYVLFYSIFYGNFKLFYKSLDPSIKISLFNFISEAFECGQIETILFLKNELKYSQSETPVKVESSFNDNNCFFYYIYIDK